MIVVVVVAESMIAVQVLLKTVVGVVHLRPQRGLHLRLGRLVARIEPVLGLWMLLLQARYSPVLLLKLSRTLDGQRCSGLCVHGHREQEGGSQRG